MNPPKPVPTYEDLLRAVKEFEDLQGRFSFCEYCVKIKVVYVCEKCGIRRCDSCFSGQNSLLENLLPYLALLNIQLDILSYIKKLIDVRINYCYQCWRFKCNNCFKFHRGDLGYNGSEIYFDDMPTLTDLDENREDWGLSSRIRLISPNRQPTIQRDTK